MYPRYPLPALMYPGATRMHTVFLFLASLSIRSLEMDALAIRPVLTGARVRGLSVSSQRSACPRPAVSRRPERIVTKAAGASGGFFRDEKKVNAGVIEAPRSGPGGTCITAADSLRLSVFLPTQEAARRALEAALGGKKDILADVERMRGGCVATVGGWPLRNPADDSATTQGGRRFRRRRGRRRLEAELVGKGW